MQHHSIVACVSSFSWRTDDVEYIMVVFGYIYYGVTKNFYSSNKINTQYVVFPVVVRYIVYSTRSKSGINYETYNVA